MAKVAFLGLGVMGYPMAGHLKDRGHDVTVYNRTAAKADKWVADNGGIGRDDPARGGRRARRSSSPASATTTTCARSRSATTARSRRMEKGAIFVDNTTASAEVARELAALRPGSAASASSTRRCPAARPARKTACSP